VTAVFLRNFAGVAQVAGVPVGACVAELERTVIQLGFVGRNLKWTPICRSRSW
jgi:hypothetical protein